VQVHLTRRRGSNEDSWDISDTQRSASEIDLRECDECALTLKVREEELTEGMQPIALTLSGSQTPPCSQERSEGCSTIRWEWAVDFYAGQISLELTAGAKPLWHCVLDVRTHEGKLGQTAYDELVQDLEEYLENVAFGTTAAERSVMRSDTSSPPIARFSMLRAHITQIERNFAVIAETPNRRLIANREYRPLDQARRLDGKTIRGIIRNPAALAALGYATSTIELADRVRIDHPRREHTYNTPVNRHIAALIYRMECVCRDLHAAFRSLAKASGGDPAAQARATGLANETVLLQRRVSRFARTEFLQDVPIVSGDTAALIGVAKAPAYSRFDRLSRRVLTPRSTLGQSIAEKLWLRRTYELYEYWCFFRVADALVEKWPHLQWQFSKCADNSGLLLDIRDGCYVEAVAGDTRLRLTFQQTFSSYSPAHEERDKPYSISGERRPDLVLSARSGDRHAMIVLDAKYRCNRSAVHSALADMHVYRDSLRVSGHGDKLLAAYILTPAHDESGAGVYYTEDYRRQYRTGGFDLAPGRADQASALCEHVAAILNVKIDDLQDKETRPTWSQDG